MATTYNTQTAQSGPPDWQVPYLQQGLQYSQNLLNAGAPQYYPGQTVTPFSQATEQAMQGIQQRAQAGTPGRLAPRATQARVARGLRELRAPRARAA